MENYTPKPLLTSALTAEGWSTHSIRSRVETGDLHRLRRGVYGPSTLDGDVQRHVALISGTAALTDESSVVSYESAALLHGLPLPSVPGQVTHTRRTNGHADASTSLRVRDTRLDDQDVTVVRGVQVTTVARTVIDVARLLDYEWGVAVCDAALHLGLVDLSQLTDVLDRQHRLRGVPKARAVVRFADGRAESPAESISRVNIVRFGLPEPILQHELIDANGVLIARLDFFWEKERLAGEVDGRWKYGELLRPGETPERAIMREKQREEQIRSAGYWITRWGWATANNPVALGRQLETALNFQRDRWPQGRW